MPNGSGTLATLDSSELEYECIVGKSLSSRYYPYVRFQWSLAIKKSTFCEERHNETMIDMHE